MDSILYIRHKIDLGLLGLIDNDYIYLDLPYYTNVGDILIWKGTEEFLKQNPYKCLYRASIETYVKQKVSKSVIILMQGGGNFGDLWRRHVEFTLKIIEEYPENRIIILPQTVHYENSEMMMKDAQVFSFHKKLTICARDNKSYKILNEFFYKNKIILVPDMAFYIGDKFLANKSVREGDKALFFKRKDKEYLVYDYNKFIDKSFDLEEHEWPSLERRFLVTKVLSKLLRIKNILSKRIKGLNAVSFFIDWYANKIFMPILLYSGIRFMSGYKYVYSTRLHGAILALLLKKHIVLFDNSYGKNGAIYNTWLKNFDNIDFVGGE